MKTTDIAMIVSALSRQIEDAISHAVNELSMDFEARDENNERAADEHTMYATMCNYMVMSVLAAKYKKEYEACKKLLDKYADNLGEDPEGVAGITKDILTIGNLNFSKKQNQPSTMLSAVDLTTELARVGVEKELVDKATDAATKEKKGNTYYLVAAKE